MKKYIWNLLLTLDQGINALLGGDPDETISSRAGKAMLKGKRWGCVLCRLLDVLEKDHCINNIEPDEGSRALIGD